METFCLDSPIGKLTVVVSDQGLRSISFTDEKVPLSSPSTSFGKEVEMALAEYFAGKRTSFTDIPLDVQGTDFQKKVWAELMRIGYGQTRSYGEIAQKLGKPKAARAVGSANHDNQIPIIIPCHRVVGSDGQLTGYAGGLDVKTKLLVLEGARLV